MQININKVIDEAKLNGFILRVAFICCLCSIVEGFEMIVLGMIIPNLAQEWGLKPQDFQLAQFAVVFGILVGSICAGFMSDKIGRRKTILIMFGLGVVGMGASIFIQNMNQLIGLRFMTGVGAGGSLPIALALVSEYAPAKYRNIMIAVVYAGAPFSTTVGGFVGPYFLTAYGWQGMFMFGFGMALPLFILMLFFLPDSIKYRVSAGDGKDSTAKGLLAKVAPQLSLSKEHELVNDEPKLEKGPVRELFSSGRGTTTGLLWLAFIGGQFIIYFISLWLPTILQANGWEQGESLRAVGQYYLGGSIGTILIGYFQDRIGIDRVLLIAFPIAAVFFFILGQSVDNHELWFTLAPFAGMIAVGAVMGKAQLAASLYPTSMRGTGVGSALGVGRIGSLITPSVGAVLVAAGITATQFFNVIAIAPLVSAFAIFAIIMVKRAKN